MDKKLPTAYSLLKEAERCLNQTPNFRYDGFGSYDLLSKIGKYFRENEDKEAITLKLPDLFVIQLLEGIIARKEAYENTAKYMESEGADFNEESTLLEVTDSDEARRIADFYGEIIESIETQRKEQT